MSVWIDTDMGVDDLFAILLVAKHTRIDGISLSFGNAPLPYAMAHAAAAARVFGWTMPITVGAARAVLGGLETAQSVLGQTGMPSRGRTLPVSDGEICFPPAIPSLTAWLAGQSQAQILALGPLSNLAALVLCTPELIQNIGRITWMGGAVGQGNHTAAAEFNAYADPEALAILLSRNIPLTMVDLDICRRIQLTKADVAAVSNPLLRDLARGYLDIGLSRGRASMALYDPVAAAAFLQPDLFTPQPAEITVELCGQHTRGRTTVDPRRPGHAQVLRDVDAALVHRLCLAGLER